MTDVKIIPPRCSSETVLLWGCHHQAASQCQFLQSCLSCSKLLHLHLKTDQGRDGWKGLAIWTTGHVRQPGVGGPTCLLSRLVKEGSIDVHGDHLSSLWSSMLNWPSFCWVHHNGTSCYPILLIPFPLL